VVRPPPGQVARGMIIGVEATAQEVVETAEERRGGIFEHARDAPDQFRVSRIARRLPILLHPPPDHRLLAEDGLPPRSPLAVFNHIPTALNGRDDRLAGIRVQVDVEDRAIAKRNRYLERRSLLRLDDQPRDEEAIYG